MQHARPPCPSATPRDHPTHDHRVSDAIQPLSSPFPTVPNPSQRRSLFQWVNTSQEVSKVLEFSFSIIPSKEHRGLISFRMDWLDLLAVQGTLKSLRQHHSSKASILRHSAFFTVQFSHPYMTTGKTIALTRLTFVGKVMSLLLNMLSSTNYPYIEFPLSYIFIIFVIVLIFVLFTLLSPVTVSLAVIWFLPMSQYLLFKIHLLVL